MPIEMSCMDKVNRMTQVPEAEEDLVTHFLTSRDGQTFATLVRRSQDFAYRVAFGRCGNGTLAEEIVQEAFLHLFRPGCRFTPAGPGSFRRWLCSVVTNVANKHHRSEVRALKAPRTKEPQDLHAAAAEATRPASLEPLTDDTRRALRETLGSLAEDLRLPIILYYFEGLTQAQAGRMIGVSQTLVARRIQQGLELMRKRLGARGVTTSSSALALLLHGPDLLPTPATLRANLATLDASHPAAPTTSGRVSRHAPTAGWTSAPLAAAFLATLAAAIFFLPAKPEPPARDAAPIAEATRRWPEPAAGDGPAAPGGLHAWTFDQGLDAEFRRSTALPLGIQDFPLPDWLPKAGAGRTGALRFAPTGGSLLLPITIPTGRILPLRLTFEAKALDATHAHLGTALTSPTALTPKALAGLPKSLRVTTWQTGRWVRWERRVTLRDDGRLDCLQTYGGQPVGQVGVAQADWYTTPGERIHLEIHGTNMLIDNLRLTYGVAAAEELAREAAAEKPR